MIVAAINTYDGSPRPDSLRHEHLDYLNGLYAEGSLFAGGPVDGGDGAIFLFDAESAEDVAWIVDRDPLVVAGVVSARALHRWDLLFANPGPLGAAEAALAERSR